MLSAAVVDTDRAVANAGVITLGRKALVVWKALVVTNWIATLQALIVCFYGKIDSRRRTEEARKDRMRGALFLQGGLFQPHLLTK